jgi:outer membrane protein OmpA-like peptidoglycan-associated protein
MAQARTLAGMGRLTATLGVTRPDQPTASDAGQDRGELPPDELCPFEAPRLMAIDKAKMVADVLPYRPRSEPVAVAAPAPAPVPVPVIPAKSTFASDALFDFDKSELKPEGKKALDELIGKIKSVDLQLAIAVGHTDSVGSEAYNLALSTRRAESVKSYMVSQGLPANKITTVGKGESQPVASNDTAQGRAKNRRVDIEVQVLGVKK